MSPSRNDIPESTLVLFLALCDPFREAVPGDISQQSWENISELSKLHGVTPFLFYRTRQLGIPVPEKIKKEWLGIYLYSLAQEQKARRQIKELKEINQTGIFWQIESENGKICNKRREVRWHPPIKRNF